MQLRSRSSELPRLYALGKGGLGAAPSTAPHRRELQPLISARREMRLFPASTERTEHGLKAGVKKRKKKCNEKLETLIRSCLSTELLRRKKTCSVPTASITVGSDVKCCLVQRAPRKPELMSLVLFLALRYCSTVFTSSFPPRILPDNDWKG